MRVLAAKFPDRERASAALASLQQELNNGLEADIAPLAVDERHADAMLLAGQFNDEMKPEVTTIVEASGGEIVADVDVAWTVPRYRSTR